MKIGHQVQGSNMQVVKSHFVKRVKSFLVTDASYSNQV